MRDAIERGLKHSAYDYANAIDFMEQSYQSYKEVFEKILNQEQVIGL